MGVANCQNQPMTYDEIAAVFFATPDKPIAVPTVTDSPARRLRDAVEPIATHGWWARRPAERLTALGLGFFDAYVWGRAAALGNPTAAVVVATFGVFEPGLLSAVYAHGSSVASRDDVLAARADGASESLAALVTEHDAATIADPLLDAIASLDGMGKPLFSALRSLPTPPSAQGRLWRAAELVREHRGDGHLAACVAAGLDAVTMNVFTELWLAYELGGYSSTRGFTAEQLAGAVDGLTRRGWIADGALTEAGRIARITLENTTDRTQDDLITALGDSVEDLIERTAVISQHIIDSKAFPSDPRKRAAG